MRQQRRAAGLLVAATLAAGTGATSDPPETDVLFNETFDDDANGWGIIEHSEFGTATYDGGDYVWSFTGSSGHLLPEVLGVQYEQGELDMVDVTVRAAATIVDGDGVIGVFCRENPDTDAEWQWYEFVARDGFAAIRRADSEGNLEVLEKTDEVRLPIGEPMTIEATCLDEDDGTVLLEMSLNDGTSLEARDDDPLVTGAPGIQAYTHPVHAPMDIRWHEFAVSRAVAATSGG